MGRYRKSLGERGEHAAEKALTQRGYRLLERNYLVRGGEIDLIMERSEEIVFVEVKTRTSDRFGSPLEGIDARKKDTFITPPKCIFLKTIWNMRQCHFVQSL